VAKPAMRPEVRAAKKRDNRTSHLELVCHAKDCKHDFYVAYNGVRKCAEHFGSAKPATEGDAIVLALKQLGLIF
jgi:hypothetical protein